MSDTPQSLFQNLFVRLATDRPLLERFLEDPETFLDTQDLDARARRALLGIPRDRFVRYADGLLAKRAREFERAVPASVRICPSLPRRYRRWLASNPAPRAFDVLGPGLREALRARSALGREIAEDSGEASYAADLFLFETSLSASRRDGRVREFNARYRVDELSAQIRRGEIPVDPEFIRCRFRISKEGVLWRPNESAERNI